MVRPSLCKMSKHRTAVFQTAAHDLENRGTAQSVQDVETPYSSFPNRCPRFGKSWYGAVCARCRNTVQQFSKSLPTIWKIVVRRSLCKMSKHRTAVFQIAAHDLENRGTAQSVQDVETPYSGFPNRWSTIWKIVVRRSLCKMSKHRTAIFQTAGPRFGKSWYGAVYARCRNAVQRFSKPLVHDLENRGTAQSVQDVETPYSDFPNRWPTIWKIVVRRGCTSSYVGAVSRWRFAGSFGRAASAGLAGRCPTGWRPGRPAAGVCGLAARPPDRPAAGPY